MVVNATQDFYLLLSLIERIGDDPTTYIIFTTVRSLRISRAVEIWALAVVPVIFVELEPVVCHSER